VDSQGLGVRLLEGLSPVRLTALAPVLALPLLFFSADSTDSGSCRLQLILKRMVGSIDDNDHGRRRVKNYTIKKLTKGTSRLAW